MQPLPAAPQASPAMATQALAAPQQKPAPQPLVVPPTVHAAAQAPALHVGVPPAQAWHALPPLPQVASAVPATQVVPSQQPPLQRGPPLHDGEQVRVVGSHA